MIVRIPAVISASGKWCAYGWDGCERSPDWSGAEEIAGAGFEEGGGEIFQRIWITVDLPIPETAEVIGEVEK